MWGGHLGDEKGDERSGAVLRIRRFSGAGRIDILFPYLMVSMASSGVPGLQTYANLLISESKDQLLNRRDIKGGGGSWPCACPPAFHAKCIVFGGTQWRRFLGVQMADDFPRERRGRPQVWQDLSSEGIIEIKEAPHKFDQRPERTFTLLRHRPFRKRCVSVGFASDSRQVYTSRNLYQRIQCKIVLCLHRGA